MTSLKCDVSKVKKREISKEDGQVMAKKKKSRKVGVSR
jgi:hypothetical protein